MGPKQNHVKKKKTLIIICSQRSPKVVAKMLTVAYLACHPPDKKAIILTILGVILEQTLLCCHKQHLLLFQLQQMKDVALKSQDDHTYASESTHYSANFCNDKHSILEENTFVKLTTIYVYQLM